MSRFSGPKFRVSITNRIQSLWDKLPVPSAGRGEPDSNSALFRSYGSQVTRVSPYPNPGLTRQPIDTTDLDQSFTQNISFALLSVVGQRRMALSQLLIGPCMVESIDFEANPVTNDSNIAFSMFVSETPELPQTITPRPSGVDVFAPQALGAGVLAPDDTTGLLITGQNAPRLVLSHPLGIHVPLDRFFLKPSVVHTAGPVIAITGYIRVRYLHHGITIGGKRAYRT